MYEFDLATLLRTLNEKKKYFFINTGIAIIIGLIVAFSIPKTYKSQIRLASESPKSGLSGGMGAVAAMAGINLSTNEDAISPELYPTIVASNKFLIDLLYLPVKNKEGKSYPSLLAFYQTETKEAWWSAGINSVIKGIKSLFTTNTELSFSSKNRINPQQLTLKEEALLNSFKQQIICSIDKETGVITLSALSQDPLVAKNLAEAAAVKLQKFITDYRTNKARIDLQYYSTLEKQFYEKYKHAQQSYIEFSDSHNDLFLKSYTTKETDLENQMQNAFNAYAQMKQQVGIAEGKVQEKTPAFTIVEDAYVPNRADSPKKLLLLIAFSFIGFVGTGIWFYLRLLFPAITPQ